MELINQKIENIDISDIESAKLFIKGGGKIEIDSEKFYKIVILITDNTKKLSFLPNELNSIYNYILQNYETQLEDDEFNEIKEKLFIFVQNGGSVFIKYKLTLKKFILGIGITFGLAITYILIVQFINLFLINIFGVENLQTNITEEEYNNNLKLYLIKNRIEYIIGAIRLFSMILFPFHLKKLNQKYKIPTKFAGNLLLILIIIGIFAFCGGISFKG